MALFRKNYSKIPDEELMSMLANGGQSAFDELYKRYAGPMLIFFLRMLNFDKGRAEDMLHDLFLKIIEHPHSFDHSRTFSTWFYTLAGNMLKNEYRSKCVRAEHNVQHFQQFDSQFVFNNENVDKDLFHSKLEKELDKLDVDSQLLFRLRFTEEMSVKQIAEITDCPEGTVKSRLFYLTKLLSKKLMIYKPELNQQY